MYIKPMNCMILRNKQYNLKSVLYYRIKLSPECRSYVRLYILFDCLFVGLFLFFLAFLFLLFVFVRLFGFFVLIFIGFFREYKLLSTIIAISVVILSITFSQIALLFMLTH